MEMEERRKMPYSTEVRDGTTYVISSAYNDKERRSGDVRRVNTDHREIERRLMIIEETRMGDDGMRNNYTSC